MTVLPVGIVALLSCLVLAAWVTFQQGAFTRLSALGRAVWNACVQAAKQRTALPEADVLHACSVWRNRSIIGGKKHSTFVKDRISVRVGLEWKALVNL
jgi:hypothetical protein